MHTIKNLRHFVISEVSIRKCHRVIVPGSVGPHGFPMTFSICDKERDIITGLFQALESKTEKFVQNLLKLMNSKSSSED